jgi:outer membrane protein assembly factor BamA
MRRIIMGISFFLFALVSLSAQPSVKYRQVSIAQQTSSDEWKSGNFDILEGLTVRRIEFHGNANTPDRVLRRTFWIKEGNIFSRKGLARSLKRLNQLGLFDRITEEDISWQKDDGMIPSGEVDFIIRVKEKRRR